MNRYCASVILIIAAFGSFFACTTTGHAQTSAFSYQGRLLGGSGQPANGNFDLQFKLRDATTNQVGATLTNAPVTVSNGLFTTTLDFGGLSLNGTPRFLEIGVRTNGSSAAYDILSPLQPVTSVPYAYRAAVASSYPGSITDNQLTANIPRLNGNSVFTGPVTATGTFSGTLSGTFSGASIGTFSGNSSGTFSGTAGGTINGNGAGLTNVNITNVVGILPANPIWQVVQTLSQQALANTSYLTTNNSQVTVILPASPGLGTMMRISGAGAGGWKLSQNAGQSILTGNLGLPAGNFWTTNHALGNLAWQAVASSADGAKMVAAVSSGFIYTSVDSGATWTQRATSQAWHSVASSADGTRLAAAVSSGLVYTSVDSGANWTARAGSLAWYSIASSADGTKLAAVVNNGFIYTSVDAGTNWTQRASSLPWVSIASSVDGVKLVAVANNDKIYTSADSGVTWTNRDSNRPWIYVASSGDGVKLVAVANNDWIYTSGDSGANWTRRDSATRPWSGVACSADGKNMVAVANGDKIYSSYDAGQTWTARFDLTSNSHPWRCVAYSGNGTRLLAAEFNGLLYNSAASTSVGGYLTGIQYSAVELQYIGGGLWMPVSSAGTFYGN
ncbi:MAG: hypothetical protein JWR69_2135 [Pedosphaera sp.]|nr:hypothetical protein [Pedosphaera sp.]